MRKTQVQQNYIDMQKRSRKAKGLSKKDRLFSDDVYHGKATDNSCNYDKKEINSYMDLP